MKKTTLISYFGGSTKTAVALQVKQPAVTQWPEDLPFSVLGRLAELQPAAWDELKKLDAQSKTTPST